MNIAYAQSQAILITSGMALRGVLCNIFNLIFWVLIAVSTVIVLLGAFMYTTAQGDSEKVSKATKMITYAAIGIVVALFAQKVPTITAHFFGATADACGTATSSSINYEPCSGSDCGQ
jgi:chromate transport protein ChrA